MSLPTRSYADPYLAGLGLGLVLLAVLVVTGRGLGASGALAAAAAGAVQAVSADAARRSPYLARALGEHPWWRQWLVAELAGVALGGFLSALWSGRLSAQVERGRDQGRLPRLALAYGGGAVMGLGAVLAGGCTSGLALTGGAMLGVGPWLFMLALFAGAYLLRPALLRWWR